jgi:hypothetical protein
MMFPITADTPPNTRRPDGEHRRPTPSAVFLDFDPILPGWPVPDGAPKADAHAGVRERRRRRKAKRRSKS